MRTSTRKKSVLLGLLVASVALITVIGIVSLVNATSGDGSTRVWGASAGIPPEPTKTVRRVKDFDLPICQDIRGPGPETVHSAPSGPPVLPRDGKHGNVRCGTIPTKVKSPTPLPNAAPSLAPDYRRHVGAQVTNSSILAVWGSIKVSNPSVPHSANANHAFYARPLAKKQISGSSCPFVGGYRTCWIEAGWTETESLDDDRYVYWYNTQDLDEDEAYIITDWYSLTDGNEYAFAVQYEGQDPPVWSAFIWWNGAWECLTDESSNCGQPLGFSYAGWAEEYAEVATTNGTGDFAIEQVRFGGANDIQIQEGATLKDWTYANFSNTVPTSSQGAYSVSWNSQFDDWSADD